jgi:hypothetical protein
MIICVAQRVLTGEVKYMLVLKYQQILPDDEINRETGSTANRIRSAQGHNMLIAVAEISPDCKINAESGSRCIRHPVAFYLEDKHDILFKPTLSQSKLKVDLRSRKV